MRTCSGKSTGIGMRQNGIKGKGIMFFFIADTHFGHGAIIDLCHRPFKCVEEMDSIMIGRWNKKVSPNDTVYIVGDLFYKHKNPEKT